MLCILRESCYGKWLWVAPRRVYVPRVMEMKWTHADKNLSYIIWNDYGLLLLLLGSLPQQIVHKDLLINSNILHLL